MPIINEAGALISPGTSAAYATVYEVGHYMPVPQDPGWITCVREATGDKVRVIRIHGPFDLLDAGEEIHCAAGWLALDADGNPYVVPDSNDLSGLPPGHTEVR